LKTNNTFAYELMMFYAEELHWSEQKMASLFQLSVKKRFIVNLLYLIDHLGLDKDNVLKAELTKTDLAAYIGTTYETMHRVISEMVNENILIFSGKRIKIADLEN
jgi:CRP-like cAMP-binding protein